MIADRPKVLLVDDTEGNLVALQALLSKLPCDLVLAQSGREALAAMSKDSFAVVLLDVILGDMNGYEVAALAHDRPSTSEIPIVFVTATQPGEDETLRGYGAGAVDFLIKPINPRILVSKVKVFLDLWNGKQRLAREIEAHKETIAEREAFNYSVSHDLRAPLRAVAGFSDVLLEDYGGRLDDEGKSHLERIRTAARRMDQLIDDMLTLSRMARHELKIEPVDLAPIAAEAIDELRRTEPRREVRFSSAQSVVAQGDARMLRILLENLLGNAWKFTRPASSPQIELGVLNSGSESTVFFVRDNGVGFDMQRASGLFQPFRRMHSSSEFEGTGIGLAIAQRIVRRHSGAISIESAPGRGTTVSVSLPRAEGEPRAAA